MQFPKRYRRWIVPGCAAAFLLWDCGSTSAQTSSTLTGRFRIFAPSFISVLDAVNPPSTTVPPTAPIMSLVFANTVPLGSVRADLIPFTAIKSDVFLNIGGRPLRCIDTQRIVSGPQAVGSYDPATGHISNLAMQLTVTHTYSTGGGNLGGWILCPLSAPNPDVFTVILSTRAAGGSPVDQVGNVILTGRVTTIVRTFGQLIPFASPQGSTASVTAAGTVSPLPARGPLSCVGVPDVLELNPTMASRLIRAAGLVPRFPSGSVIRNPYVSAVNPPVSTCVATGSTVSLSLRPRPIQ